MVVNVLAYAIVGSIAAWIIGLVGYTIVGMLGSPWTYTTSGTYTYNYLSLYHIGLVIVESITTGAITGFFTLCIYQYWKALSATPSAPAAAPTMTTPQA